MIYLYICIIWVFVIYTIYIISECVQLKVCNFSIYLVPLSASHLYLQYILLVLLYFYPYQSYTKEGNGGKKEKSDTYTDQIGWAGRVLRFLLETTEGGVGINVLPIERLYRVYIMPSTFKTDSFIKWPRPFRSGDTFVLSSGTVRLFLRRTIFTNFI